MNSAAILGIYAKGMVSNIKGLFLGNRKALNVVVDRGAEPKERGHSYGKRTATTRASKSRIRKGRLEDQTHAAAGGGDISL